MPTFTTGDQGNATQQLNIKLPPIAGQGPNGGHERTGGLGAILSRSTGPKIQYRSIPPKPSNFTMSDIITSHLTPTIRGRKLKATPVSINSPSEFAQRFRTRPITQPKVIDFDPQNVAMETRRGVHGFFPPVKLRGSAKKNGDSEPIITYSEIRIYISNTS
ncbi:hypothetical protein ACJMK2_034386 [Sinanodonta woodiana]|uniref:Uncharacterized protein n=1 Tax=Sinanodonta woodiana TaxID=1069815 RepID=A0ABD3WRD2_SINWO